MNQTLYLSKQKALTGSLFIEQSSKDRFKKLEVEKATNVDNLRYINNPNRKEIDLMYIAWLENTNVNFNLKESLIDWPLDKNPNINIFDTILLELDLIENIFKAQYTIIDPEGDLFAMNYPTILDEHGKSGKGINGKYIASMQIWSNVELFNRSLYKAHFTERFETTTNYTLLKNQIAELLLKAKEVVNYYNKNLTNKNIIVSEYLGLNKLPLDVRFEKQKKHDVFIVIDNYFISSINYSNGKIPKSIEKRKYNYLSWNLELATIIQELVDFFIRFNEDSLQNENLPQETTLNLSAIFSSDYNGFEVCKGIFEDLGLTIDSIPNMNKHAGKLIGIFSAIKKQKGMLKSDYTDETLLDYFNSYLKCNFKTIKKNTKGYEEAYDDAKRFIINNLETKVN